MFVTGLAAAEAERDIPVAQLAEFFTEQLDIAAQKICGFRALGAQHNGNRAVVCRQCHPDTAQLFGVERQFNRAVGENPHGLRDLPCNEPGQPDIGRGSVSVAGRFCAGSCSQLDRRVGYLADLRLEFGDSGPYCVLTDKTLESFQQLF